MRFAVAAAVVAVAAAIGSLRQTPATIVTSTNQQPVQALTRPIMVNSLKEATQGSGAAPAYAMATADALLGAVAPLGSRRERALGAHVNADLQTLQSQMQAQSSTLKALQDQLTEGFKQKRRLQLAQRLMAGILQMNKAERARKAIEGRIGGVKNTLKRLAADADAINDNLRRSESERRRELAEQTRRLVELRASVKKEEASLQGLVRKKDAVGVAVTRWKEHVEQLRDLQRAVAAGPQAIPDDVFALPPRRVNIRGYFGRYAQEGEGLQGAAEAHGAAAAGAEDAGLAEEDVEMPPASATEGLEDQAAAQ